jgi:hypothetical protein
MLHCNGRRRLFEGPLRVGTAIPKLAMPMHGRLGPKPTIRVRLSGFGDDERFRRLWKRLREMPRVGPLQDAVFPGPSGVLSNHRTAGCRNEYQTKLQKEWDQSHRYPRPCLSKTARSPRRSLGQRRSRAFLSSDHRAHTSRACRPIPPKKSRNWGELRFRQARTAPRISFQQGAGLDGRLIGSKLDSWRVFSASHPAVVAKLADALA